MKLTTHRFNTEQALHEAAAEQITRLAAEAIAAHNAFHIALAGGTTPGGLYRTLARPAYASRIAWQQVHIWFGDERCVAPDHPESNFRMARLNLLDRVPLPQSNVHRIEGERPPGEAAAAYARLVTQRVAAERGLPRFDLVLLGVGTDGHVASLFPETEILQQQETVAAIRVEKLNAWRVSLTLPVINNARRVFILAAGARKAEIVHRLLAEAPGATPLPAQRVMPEAGVDWYLDAAAAKHLGAEQNA